MTPIRGPKANTGRGEAPSPDPSPVGGRKLKNEEGRVCHVLAAAESLRHVPPAQKTASHLSSKSASPSLGLLAYFRCDLRLFVAYSFLLHLIRRFAEIKVSPPRSHSGPDTKIETSSQKTSAFIFAVSAFELAMAV
ncbi:hypothetical protein IFM51744_08806 [Aspergillus udagawae]|nr:hypothetical protein IFM51744_08806 [Aspergillus udagawae]